MNIHEQIAIMQAFADGKEIDCRLKHANTEWTPIKNPNWNWVGCDYRIKPEREITITFTEKELKRLQHNWAFFNQDGELNGAIYKKLCNSSQPLFSFV